MLTLKLAYRNLVGAGLRTWLNVGVLSFTYVLIIWHQGLFSGMYRQASRDFIKDEIAGGQYWIEKYDPYDPLSLDESHGVIPGQLDSIIENRQATPILIRQGTIYPEGRVQSILIKGIDPAQTLLDIPTARLSRNAIELPVMVGKMMAKKNSLQIGDTLTIRWRDINGTFDAADGEIVAIMNTNVPTMDMGQIWVPLKSLQEMSGLENEATLVVVDQETRNHADLPGWRFKDHDYLLKDINDVVKSKRAGNVVLYAILLLLSMLAIFDTQVLSIFRRRKEIGTLMALGMVRSKVIALFTLEGMLHGILGIAIAALYGIPALIITGKIGIPMPSTAEEYGFALPTRLFPVYSTWLVSGTVFIVMLTVTIVSYLPSRKISGLKPTEVLKGKLS
jgi:putative ABC transport system permease protein